MKQKIKLCGINNQEVLKFIINYNYKPDFLGFVFYEASSRFISLKQAEEFCKVIPANIKKVAVTVNADKNYLKNIKDKLKPDIFQLHGEETIEYITQNFTTEKIIKAIAINNKNDFNKISLYQEYVDYFLFDTKTIEFGGSGASFDWNLLKNVQINKPYFLSGGLNITNLPQALTLNSNYFDLSSGIELQKGVKDRKKIVEILDFFKNINEK